MGERDIRPLVFRVRSPSKAESEKVCRECGRPTEGGKPFCIEHLERNRYAGEVLRRIAQRALDDELARSVGHQGASFEATTCQEIVLYLEWRGERTFRRLCRDLALDREVAWVYVTKLFVHGRLTRTRSDAGVWRVRLLDRS